MESCDARASEQRFDGPVADEECRDDPGGIFSAWRGISPVMTDAPAPAAITIRPAGPEDAEKIAWIFLASARYHAGLDPERYAVPAIAGVSARYRDGRQYLSENRAPAITLVAEVAGEVVGFVDARLEQSHDPMHREMTYCDIAEIAVSGGHQRQGIGRQLLSAAEEWGRLRGATFASLEYHIANKRAGAFYQRRMGYSVAATILIKRL